MPEIKATPETCDHPFVHINGIKRAYSDLTKSREIKGNCERCGKEVSRTVDRFEMESGKTEIWYR